MECRVEQLAQCQVVHVSGEVDMRNAGELEACVLPCVESCGSGRLILDVADVSYMSSMGLRVIMKAAQAAQAHGGSFEIAGARGVMLEILQISRFDQVLAMHPDLDTALRAGEDSDPAGGSR